MIVFNLNTNQNIDPENYEHQRLNFDVYTNRLLYEYGEILTRVSIFLHFRTLTYLLYALTIPTLCMTFQLVNSQ